MFSLLYLAFSKHIRTKFAAKNSQCFPACRAADVIKLIQNEARTKMAAGRVFICGRKC